MPEKIKAIIIAGCIILPFFGYFFMHITNKNVRVMLTAKVVDKGIYKRKPVYGDDVIPIAQSFKRAGILMFSFTIAFSLLCAVILYLRG